MKKIIAIMCAVIATGAFVCGCTNSSDVDNNTNTQTSAQSQKEVKLNGVFEDIEEQVKLPEMIILDEVSDLERYYGISESDVEDFAGGIDNSGVAQDEIVFIKAKDDTAADNIQKSLQKRYDSKLSQQQNYNADEAAKIQKCKVEKNGKYVTLIISNDAEKITEIFKGSIK